MSLPSFPPEIWRSILQLSVKLPGSLQTKWDYSPDTMVWPGLESPRYYEPSEERREYYSTLKTKLSIVQVSRAWRYEHLLFIDQADPLQDLEVVFESMAMVAATFEQHMNENGYGRATKRIDVPTSSIFQSILPTLMHLLSFCHNLRILIIFEGPWSCVPNHNATSLSDLTSLLQTRFNHSLRRMAFNIVDGDIHLPDLPLDSLEFGTDRSSSSAHEPPPAAISTMSALTLQTAAHSLPRIVSWQYPALRHLTLINMDYECTESCFSFVTSHASHGPQLLSLALFSSTLLSWGHTTDISRLIAPATNLRCLVFDLLDVCSLSESFIFPSITHIGVRIFTTSQRSMFNSSWFFSPSIFPNLQCLRFFDLSKQRPGWLLDIARKFDPIRVENRDCQLIL